MEVVEDGNKKKWIKCLLCNEVLKGVGVHRLKLHLAGVVSAVKGCKNVTAEVRYEMEQSIEKFAGRKRRADEATTRVRGATDGDDCMEVSPQLVVSSTRAIQAKKGKGVALSNAATNHRADRFFLSRGQPGDQQTIKSMLQSQEAVERVDLIINKWFLDASIAFNATTSKYHQPMIDAIASIGDGYQVPSMYRMRGPLLRKNVENTRNFVESYRKSWKESGCGIMADGWTDRKRRTLVNFLVYCPKGTIFLKSVDASTANSKIGDFLFKLFSNVVRFVGVENVVYFVTDNASNMVLTGKKLDAEFPSIYWSPCAAHCLNLIMTDLGKLELVQSTVAHASKITRYLYNHCTPLFLMRKFTNGHEILRPAPTRFATNFVALQSIHKQKDALRTMVISKEWTTASFAKELKARKIVDLILDQQFWNDCASICNFSEPLGRVLRIVDNDERPAMGYLFGALHCAIEEIEKRFQRKKKAIQQNIVNAIEARWDKHINKNLHVAGFWFNPINQYDEELMSKYHTTTFGVLDCIERYATKDPALSKALTTRMRIFRNAEGDFGRVTTINDRYTMLPGPKSALETLTPYVWRILASLMLNGFLKMIPKF